MLGRDIAFGPGKADLLAVRETLAALMILVTHDVFEAAAPADRIVVVDCGQLLLIGRVAAVLAAPAAERVDELLDMRASQ